MDFFEVVQKRRSIRRFTEEKIPEGVIKRALEAALLAPNSSNLQTWNFFWVRSDKKRKKLVEYCLGQSAARTAAELVVVTANSKLWSRSNPQLIQYVESIQAPKPVQDYYKKLMPIMQSAGLLNAFAPIKWILLNTIGLFRPILRGPYGRGGLDEVAIKSAALTCENYVLAMAAQGYQTCMMEGFDEVRVKRLLSLPLAERVVMVIGAGKESESGTWGPQFRIPSDQVIHEV